MPDALTSADHDALRQPARFARDFADRVWQSPMAMSWGSTVARLLSFALVLPLLLRLLTPAEITTWYVFASIQGLQAVADLGFSPTFARAFAYAMGGATDVGELRVSAATRPESQPNWTLLGKVRFTALVVYRRLLLATLAPLAVAGTWALMRPVSLLPDPSDGWIAWGIMLTAAGIGVFRSYYTSYLHGMNYVAVARRWEMITVLGATVSLAIVLLLGGRLVALAATSLVWAGVELLRDAQLARRIPVAPEASKSARALDREVFGQVWHRAWRSGVGVGASLGLMHASGIVYSQIAAPAAAASYFLAFRFALAVSELSHAPFYSKIPQLARFYAEGRVEALMALASRGMRLAYWTFVLGIVSVGLIAPTALAAMDSNVPFASSALWLAMAFAFVVERFGAMHLQLFSITNRIVWHIANGVTGILMLVATTALLPILGVYAFPLGMLIGYLGFYSSWSAVLMWRTFPVKPIEFEMRTIGAPLATLLVYALATLAFPSLTF